MFKSIVIILCGGWFVAVYCAPGQEFTREKRSTLDFSRHTDAHARRTRQISSFRKNSKNSDQTQLEDLRSKEISSLSPVNEVSPKQNVYTDPNSPSVNRIPYNNYRKEFSQNLNTHELDDTFVRDSYYDRSDDRYSRHENDGPPPPPRDRRPPSPPDERHHYPPPPDGRHHYPPPPDGRHHYPPPPPPPDETRYYQPPPPPPPPPPPYDQRSSYYDRYHSPPPPPHDSRPRSYDDDRQTRQSSYYDNPPHRRGPPPPYYGGRAPPPTHHGRPPPYGGPPRHEPPPYGGGPPPDYENGYPPRPPPYNRRPDSGNFYDNREREPYQSDRPRYPIDRPPDDNPPPPGRTTYQERPYQGEPQSRLFEDRRQYDNQNTSFERQSETVRLEQPSAVPKPSNLVDLQINPANTDYRLSFDNTSPVSQSEDQHLLDVRFADDTNGANAQTVQTTPRKLNEYSTSTRRPINPFLFQAPAVTPES